MKFLIGLGAAFVVAGCGASTGSGPAAAENTVPSGWDTYTSTNGGFSVLAPKQWRAELDEGQSLVVTDVEGMTPIFGVKSLPMEMRPPTEETLKEVATQFAASDTCGGAISRSRRDEQRTDQLAYRFIAPCRAENTMLMGNIRVVSGRYFIMYLLVDPTKQKPDIDAKTKAFFGSFVVVKR